MDILGPNSGCFQEYHDTYSFRHQAKNRRSGYPRESANNANPSSSADMDANRNANANGTQGAYSDSSYCLYALCAVFFQPVHTQCETCAESEIDFEFDFSLTLSLT